MDTPPHRGFCVQFAQQVSGFTPLHWAVADQKPHLVKKYFAACRPSPLAALIVPTPQDTRCTALALALRPDLFRVVVASLTPHTDILQQVMPLLEEEEEGQEEDESQTCKVSECAAVGDVWDNAGEAAIDESNTECNESDMESKEGDMESKEGDMEGNEGDTEGNECNMESKEGDTECNEGDTESKEDDTEGDTEGKEGDTEGREGDTECTEGNTECNEGDTECNEGDAECNEGGTECNEGDAECNEGDAECNEADAECNEGDGKESDHAGKETNDTLDKAQQASLSDLDHSMNHKQGKHVGTTKIVASVTHAGNEDTPPQKEKVKEAKEGEHETLAVATLATEKKGTHHVTDTMQSDQKDPSQRARRTRANVKDERTDVGTP